jgi:hypothetical protein
VLLSQCGLWMKSAVFWDVTACALVRTDVSEEISTSIIRVTRIGELGSTLAVSRNRRTLHLHSMRQLLGTANVDPSSPILVTQMMETLSFSETSILRE